jgi:hypothetical protein
MKTKWCVVAGVTPVALAAAIAGCSSSQGSTVSSSQDSKPSAVSSSRDAKSSAAALFQSPKQATLSWFYAINDKDQADAVAHFTRAAADQMNWGNGDTSTWPTFSALHCQPAIRQSVTTASVYCTFSESQAPAIGNPDSFWTVYLQRQPDGRWLIDNYGQG